MSNEPQTIIVSPKALAIGMYVILDLSWLEHPFTFNRFLIQSEQQLATLRALGLAQYKVDPARSAQGVFAPADESGAGGGTVAVPGGAPSPASGERASRIDRLRAFRAEVSRVDKAAGRAAGATRQAIRQLRARPAESVAVTQALVGEISTVLLESSDVTVYLLGDKLAGEEIYSHALNVCVLGMLLGKALGMDAAALGVIGLAAIYHDLGKEGLPSQVLRKIGPLTRAEESLLRQHPGIGAEVAAQAGLSAAVVAAIRQHHEHVDGSGFPDRLDDASISEAAKIVAIANYYDNLCNPLLESKAMTPYEALSTMFAKRKAWFDMAKLGRLVHVLGVYPPGSIVQLSDGRLAMAVSVNPFKPLQPVVLVHEPGIPRSEALILDLEATPGLGIVKALPPASLQPSVLEYLGSRRRVAYYFSGDAREG